MRDGKMRGAVGRGGGKDVPVVGARHLARHRAKHTICNQKQNTGENRGTQALRVRCVGKVSRPTGGQHLDETRAAGTHERVILLPRFL